MFQDILYSATPANFAKANKSIKQAMLEWYSCKHLHDEAGMKYWADVIEKRVAFFCKKFECTPETLFSYF